MTTSEFITGLRNRSPVFKELEDTTVEGFVNSSLEVFSQYQPHPSVSRENERNEDEIYDKPTGALKITDVKATRTNNPIHFQIVEVEGVEKIALGDIKRPSFQRLLNVSHYISPGLSAGTSYPGLGKGFSLFDIHFNELQTLASIDATKHEHIRNYSEFLGYLYKASDPENIVNITDREPSGASTTLGYSEISKTYIKLADTKFNAFMERVNIPIGIQSEVKASLQNYIIGSYGV